jgi:hypothetical protein
MAFSTVIRLERPTRSEDIQVTAIYTQLLEAVLAFEADPATAPRSQGPMSDVLRLGRTMERHATRKDPGWALQAVADQLSYDAALIRLSRKRGIDAPVNAFDFPSRARAALEHALIELGLDVPFQPDHRAGSGSL